MQRNHEKRISEIQGKQPKNKIKLDELIKECQKEEKEELEQFKYELEQLKIAKMYEKEENLEDFKRKANEEHKKMIAKVAKEYEEIYLKYS